MAAETSRDLELEFVIAYPRQAEVGKRYLMTVDVRARGPVREWPYAEEEYALHCMVDSEPAFDNEPVGQAAVVLHRFGGTYGPARFVLTAREPMEEARIRLTLVNAAGLPLRKLELTDVRVTPPPPRERPKPIEVWLELRRERVSRYHIRLSSEVFGQLEHITTDRFEAGQYGAAMFQMLFRTEEAQRAWHEVIQRARQEERSIRLYTDAIEPFAFEQLHDLKETGSLLLLSEQPRIRVVRIARESPSAELTLPPRPGLLLAALTLEDRHHGASLLMTLARELERDYDVSLLGLDGPSRLRDVVSPLPPPAWTPEVFLPYCHTRPEDLDSLPGIHGPELLHLLVSGLEAVEPEESQERVGVDIQGLLDELMNSGAYQLAFVQTCRSQHPRTTVLNLGQPLFFPGHFSTTTGALVALIAPTAPLDAESSMSLAVSFYRRLTEGHPLDEALQGGMRASSNFTPTYMNLWARPGALDPVRLPEAAPAPKPRPAPKQAPPNSIGWLFLSNVYAGSSPPDIWEDDIQALLEDVERLYEQSGPWELVLCAGDLTRTGAPHEFESASRLFTRLRERLVELGMDPLFLMVPGNHDGNNLDPLRSRLLEQRLPLSLSNESWQRRFAEAFQDYSTYWWNRWRPLQEETFQQGLIPGDFSLTLTRNGLRLGIIGLNSVLTHRFPVHLRTQLDRVCHQDFTTWSRQHDVCMILAHEELQGLEDESMSQVPGAPFILHMTGRSHNVKNQWARLSARPFVVCNGRTLFPQHPLTKLPCGYFAGRLTLEGEQIPLRVWPRRIEDDDLSFRAEPDLKNIGDEGVELVRISRPPLLSQGAEDWAIVVGISRYPGLGDLQSPENDALAFRDWLVETAGVPERHVHLILSSAYSPATEALDARPTIEDVTRLFDRLKRLGEERSKYDGNSRVGRRLYIYFAGHVLKADREQAVLLLANATLERWSHIPGRLYADWFIQSGYFDEVFLVMDSCSPIPDHLPVPLQELPYPDLRSREAMQRGKIFYALSPKRAPRSPEHIAADGKARSPFNLALLSGLNGGASDHRGRLTAKSLADYVHEFMKDFLKPGHPDKPNFFISQPEFVYYPSPDAEFVIAQVPRSTYLLAYALDPALRGQHVRLLDDHFNTVDDFQVTDLSRRIQLHIGTYLLDVSGVQHPFTLHEDSVLRIRREGEELVFELSSLGART